MDKSLPNIFDYHDFRVYLKDYHEARQSWDKSFSRGQFSRMLGLPNTRSFINDVIRGKKISPVFIDRFIEVLQLPSLESSFFRTLVKFNQAEKIEERELYFENLVSLNQTPKRILERNVYRYYKNWYTSSIRALLNIDDYGDNPEEIAKKLVPDVTPKQVEESLTLMLELGLIEKNKQGFYKPVDKVLSTAESVKDELLKQYQMKCLELARNIIFSKPALPQRVITKTVSLSDEGYQRVEKKLAKTSSEINSIIHKDEKKADRIYQITLTLLPQTK